MNRIKCTVSYDGSGYAGWQAQNKQASVQAEIEKALFIMHKTSIPIYASGRTDAGVHATGQVFHFDSPLDIQPEKWKQAINGYTKDDIYICQVEFVDDAFHARHSCLKKTYEYRFSFAGYNVHRTKYCTQVRQPLDIEAMRAACKIFVGTHDFTSFNASPLEDRPYQIRTIDEMVIVPAGNEWIVRVRGNGFLRYMVRMMVGCLLEVGKGKLDCDTLQKWMDLRNKTCCRHNAPPQGLYLTEVVYE